jgi:hypothetical protein
MMQVVVTAGWVYESLLHTREASLFTAVDSRLPSACARAAGVAAGHVGPFDTHPGPGISGRPWRRAGRTAARDV